MKKNNTIFFLILAAILFVGYFLLLGTYPLLDPDETRYVNIARDMFKSHDYLTLYLNGEYFFEKPPLYFWLECLSFKFFCGINEWSARIPIVLLSLLPLVLLFDLCKRVKNTVFAFIVTSVLLTSFEYIILTKIAILDSVLTSFVSLAVLCYFYTFFVQEKNKKYFWCLSYLFTGCAILAKGIPGFIIPLGTILLATILFRTYKETFKYSVIGVILMLLVTLPWHIAMLHAYPNIFYQEYIYKHHILRFLGSDVIHRTQPWYFYLITLIWGFLPHIFLVIAKLFKRNFSLTTCNLDNYSKLLRLNLITVLLTLIFFSTSGTKLITYILPMYPFLSVIAGSLWIDYIKKDDILVRNLLLFFNITILVAVLVAPFITALLPFEFGGYLYRIQMLATVIVIPFSYFIFKNIILNKRFKIFVFEVLFISFLFGLITPLAYSLDYQFGQNDLIKFAKIAKEKNYTISTYMTGQKYSLLYYSGLQHIAFQTEKNPAWLSGELKKKDNIVIIRNKEISNLPVKIINKGEKFSVIVSD